MAIVQTMSVYGFIDAFKQSQYAENFSYNGLQVLFDYLEQYSEDVGQDVELDVCAIAYDFAESEVSTIIHEYNLNQEIDGLDDMDEEEQKESVIEWLNDQTMVCGDNGDIIVYQQF